MYWLDGESFLKKSPWVHMALLAAVCLGLWTGTCGGWDLWGPDESRYVQVAKELLPRGQWFLMTLHGQPYDQKPPLPFWLLAGALKLGGGQISNMLVRLPSILLGTLSVLMVYLIGRRLWNARAGLFSALVLLTSAQFMQDAPSAELNVMFTGWMTLALAMWFLRPAGGGGGWLRAACFWAAMAGAFFTKGPLALLIVFSALAGQAFFDRSWRPVRAVRPVAGLACLAILIGGWLLMQGKAAGADFVAGQVSGQTLERFLRGSHEAPFWYYLPRLFIGIFVPWGFLLVPAFVYLRRCRGALPAGMGALLGWALVPLLFLSLASGKRQSYLLPLLPAMALIVGWYLDDLAARGKAWPRAARAAGGVQTIAGGLMILGALTITFFPSLLTAHGLAFHPLGMALLGLAGGAVAGLGLWVRRRPGAGALLGLNVTGLMLAVGLIMFGVANPALNPLKSTRPFSDRLGELCRRADAPVVGGVGRGAKPEYHVYGDYRTVDFEKDGDGPAGQPLPAVLAGRESDWGTIESKGLLRGYRLAWSGQVSKDTMMIYVKDGADVVAAARP